MSAILICDDCDMPTVWVDAMQTDPWDCPTGTILCENCAERRWDRQQEDAAEGFRGGEAAAYEAEEMARIQRELK